MTMQEMKNVDISMVDPATLIDLHAVLTDETLPHGERRIDFVRQVRNPYCFLVDGTIVKVSFSDDGPALTDRLEALMLKH